MSDLGYVDDLPSKFLISFKLHHSYQTKLLNVIKKKKIMLTTANTQHAEKAEKSRGSSGFALPKEQVSL